MNTFRKNPWIFLTFACLMLPQLCLAEANAVPELDASDSAAAPGEITMNFREVDLKAFIEFISQLTGKNFLVDPNVRGSVTILSPDRVTIDEAFQVFLSVLEVNGYTTVDTGEVIKIVPLGVARTKGIETYSADVQAMREDRMVTQLVRLKYASSSEILKILRPIIPKDGHLAAYPDTETLIIADSMANIERILKIIEEIDRAGSEEVEIFTLENADASELAPKLLEVFRGAAGK